MYSIMKIISYKIKTSESLNFHRKSSIRNFTSSVEKVVYGHYFKVFILTIYYNKRFVHFNVYIMYFSAHISHVRFICIKVLDLNFSSAYPDITGEKTPQPTTPVHKQKIRTSEFITSPAFSQAKKPYRSKILPAIIFSHIIHNMYKYVCVQSAHYQEIV